MWRKAGKKKRLTGYAHFIRDVPANRFSYLYIFFGWNDKMEKKKWKTLPFSGHATFSVNNVNTSWRISRCLFFSPNATTPRASNVRREHTYECTSYSWSKRRKKLLASESTVLYPGRLGREKWYIFFVTTYSAFKHDDDYSKCFFFAFECQRVARLVGLGDSV